MVMLYWLIVKWINVFCLKVSKGFGFLVVGFLGWWFFIYWIFVLFNVCLNLDLSFKVVIGKLLMNKVKLMCLL